MPTPSPRSPSPRTRWSRARLLAALLVASLPLAAVAPALAQELPPPEAPKSKPKPKAAPKSGGSGGGQAAAAAPASPSLLLSSDMPCSITIDGEAQGKLGAKSPRKVNVSIGQHLIGAVTDDGKLKWEQIVETKGAGQQVVVRIDFSSQAASSLPADFDRRAASVWLVLADLKVAGEYAGSILKKSWGFQNRDLSGAVFTAHEALKRQMDELKKFTPTDPVRKRVLEDFGRTMATGDKYVDLLTKSIAAAQQANSWAGEPNNMYQQAHAMEASLSLPAESMNDLKNSQAFKDAVPVDRRPWLGLNRDPRDFDLGIEYYHSTPTLIAVVKKGGLGEDLGFKAGDRVVSAGGQTLSSVWDLKVLMRQNAGRRIKMVVEREGRRDEREVKVPAQLP